MAKSKNIIEVKFNDGKSFKTPGSCNSVPEINIVDELDWIQFQAVKQIREFGNTSGLKEVNINITFNQ